MSSRNIFDISALSRPGFAEDVGDLYHQYDTREPTPFHYFMDRLAATGRLLRHYTQNFDCLDTSLESLSSRTVSLHGRLDMVICTLCQASKRVSSEHYMETVGFPCESCTRRSQARISSGKRRMTIGRYRPKILLYGEPCPDDTEITACFENDIWEADAVVIAGTRLQIPSLKRFTQDLCKRVKSQGGVIIWVNTERPSLGAHFECLFQHKLQEECDNVVSQGFMIGRSDSCKAQEMTDKHCSERKARRAIV